MTRPFPMDAASQSPPQTPSMPRQEPLGDWARQALCANVDTEIFFPPPGASSAEARQICSRCPVKANCLDCALDTGEEFGIWGGLDHDERRNLKRRMRRKQARALIEGAA